MFPKDGNGLFLFMCVYACEKGVRRQLMHEKRIKHIKHYYF